MMEPHEMIDAWLSSELSVEQLGSFEQLRNSDTEFAREVSLACRTHKSLRRSFHAGSQQPAGVSRALESLGLASKTLIPSANPARVATYLAAAAGLLLLLAQWSASREAKPLERLAGADRFLTSLGSLPKFAGAVTLAGGRVVPNLEGILCTATHFTEQLALDSCADEELAAERAGMGPVVGLSGAALGLLAGPISASEWPGSMVFASQSSDGLSLLIAGSDDMNTCCLDVRAPENSELNVYTWRVGETLWYELSPFDEPRLLSLLED